MLENTDYTIGVAAGLTTSVLWTGTSLFFTAAGQRIGPTAVNTLRLFLAIIFLTFIHRILSGSWLPTAQAGQILYLAVSGVVGLTLGDQALFTAFVDIGPRRSMLIMSTAPLFAALFGNLFLYEVLPRQSWLGMILTIGGVGWVILERPPLTAGNPQPNWSRGIFLAFVGAACQAGGLLLSKQGIGHGWLPREQHLTAQTATLLRIIFGAVATLPIFGVHWLRQRKRRLAEGIASPYHGSVRSGLLLTCCGAIVGPTLGVWMSLVAGDRVPIGIAQTLCSLPPLFILPLVAWLYKEKIGPRAIIGALLAIGGIYILASASQAH
ncbi:MAG: hypothetical protein HJJLKODD_00400 [Phycisphaerae bacterium]|nr:hypothetical protein [Phycisphaerae bacterium]